MRGKIFILLVLLSAGVVNHHTQAEQPTTHEVNIVSDSVPSYTEPTSTHDTLIIHDSIIVIHTVCAPICSSHARVFNKEWQMIGVLTPPFKSAFPEAYIEDGKLLWRDNDTFDYNPCL